MGRLIMAFALSLCLPAYADGISQFHKDVIREHYEKQILGSGKDLTVRQPDVNLYRAIFTKPNRLDERILPLPADIPWPQIFTTSELTLGEILRLAGAASGYDVVIDPAVDVHQVIQINSAANSLRDIAEYLTRVSGARITVYPESRDLVATKKVSIDG